MFLEQRLYLVQLILRGGKCPHPHSSSTIVIYRYFFTIQSFIILNKNSHVKYIAFPPQYQFNIEIMPFIQSFNELFYARSKIAEESLLIHPLSSQSQIFRETCRDCITPQNIVTTYLAKHPQK